MAVVYGKPYTNAGYTQLLQEAYFNAIGMQGWKATINLPALGGLGDGVRLVRWGSNLPPGRFHSEWKNAGNRYCV